MMGKNLNKLSHIQTNIKFNYNHNKLQELEGIHE